MTFNTIRKPLPLSFTQDFKPERRLISQLLKFVEEYGIGNKHEISELTGIPTGKSSGKVEPTINYAIAMGLINAVKNGGSWTLTLTPLGKVVLVEDPYLSERISLWLIHLMLCRPLNQLETSSEISGIVGPWFTLFSISETRLGPVFSSNEFGAFMEEQFGATDKRRKLCTVVLGSYKEDSCLGLTRAIEVDGLDKVLRNKAPRELEFYPVYSAYLFLLWDEFFPKEKQISISELFKRTRILSALFWNEKDSWIWLDWMTDNGLLNMDRQTGEPVVLRTSNTLDVVENIYSELL
ncbi:hypothetical protein BCS96_09185 [Vibrio breoganii]|uniref:hypothetical protein n=1 Tax=Vibrio breoganii TaxID=553239 RepID=UPI000C848E22|nr:hypothetical protein [Vibrio breoganii]PML88781.1 hypothetical protein BCT68_04695 [Vibrio breoganii]PMO99888.1 hypothetical protein BCS96_09185 [Vibrio breoganii]